MKAICIFVLGAIASGAVGAVEELAHNGHPWITTARVIADAADVTIPFPTRFITAPMCTPSNVTHPGTVLQVTAVSRNFVILHGDMKAGDQLSVSCHMNVTRRNPDPDAVYPR